MKDDGDPVHDGHGIVDDGVTRREQQREQGARDTDRIANLNEAHEAELPGLAELDRLVGLLCRLGGRAMRPLRISTSLARTDTRVLGLLAVTHVLGNHGKAASLVGLLVGLHCHAHLANRLVGVLLCRLGDGRAIRLARTERSLHGLLGVLEHPHAFFDVGWDGTFFLRISFREVFRHASSFH